MKTRRRILKVAPHARPAVTLLEILCVVMMTGFVFGLVSEVFVSHLDVNKRLTASAARAAMTNSFTQRLRSDFLAAASFKVTSSTNDTGDESTTVAFDGPAGTMTYTFHRVDRRAIDAEGDPAIDQVIVRTDAEGEAHRWTLQAQTIDVEVSPAAPTRILTLKFKQNERSSPGFNRRENLEMSLLTGGAP